MNSFIFQEIFADHRWWPKFREQMYFYIAHTVFFKLRLVENFEDSDFCLSWKIRRIVNRAHGLLDGKN